ncbi:MAG: tetratricopeptide repeat protein [Candidatus Korobacteraceae bacterium]
MAAVREKAKAKSRKGAQAPSRAGLTLSPRARVALLVAGIVIATVVLYYPVASHPFLNYDDDIYVLNNPQVQAGLSWETVKWSFTALYASNWHPLTWLSHALDCQLFNLDAGRHHETNLLLHVINVVLLFWVLWRATRYAGRSAMVAALFALHPINVESVAWIAERKNLLSMMFFLLALGAYGWYARKPRVGPYLVVAGLYVLGLMAKPQVITLPFVLLLWDYWPLQRMSDAAAGSAATDGEAVIPAKRFSWLLLEKLPLLALAAGSAAITIRAQYESGAMSGPHWQPFRLRIENAFLAYVRYLGKAAWPSQLTLIYPHPGNSIRIWQVAAALLLLLAITGLVIAERHRRRYLLIGWLWFLGTMVPMIGIVQVGVQAMADRYAYLPFVGLFIMVCWAAADWAEQRHIAPVWQAGVGVALLLALALTARHQLDYWSDNTKLWARVIALQAQQANADNWVAENNLGHALLKLGEVEEAMPHFRAAVAINPSDPDSNLNLGAYEQQNKNLAAAIEQYKKVIAMTQNTPRLNAMSRAQAFSNMGLAYRGLKDYEQARASFQQAVNINPNDARSWLGIALLAQRSGDLNTAIQAYTRTIKISPSDWEYLLLAGALDHAGQHDAAQSARQRAIAISADITQAQKIADNVLGQ